MLTGTLDDFTLPDMFRFLATCRKTGCIEVRRDAGEGRVFLRDGAVYFGESSVTRSSEEGTYTPESLTRQIEGSFFDLLRWDGGDFTFSPDVEVHLDPSVAVEVETLITETAEKLAELQVIAGKIPSELAIPAMAPNPPGDAAQINITPEEWRVLVLVNGARTVAEIGDMVGHDPFTVMRTLYGLASTGLVEVVGEADAPASEPSGPAAESHVGPATDEDAGDDAGTLDMPEAYVAIPAANEIAEQLDAEFPPFAADEMEPAANGSASAVEPELDIEPDVSADPLALGEDAESGLPETEADSNRLYSDGFSDEDPSDDSDGSDDSAYEDDPAAAVSDFAGVDPESEPIPIEEAGREPETVVDRLAAVKELADLFEQGSETEVVGGPPYPPEIEAQREREREEATVPDTRHRVEDDEEITRGLISRLIDGVKGL